MEETVGFNLCIDEKSFNLAHNQACIDAIKYFDNNYSGNKESGKKELNSEITICMQKFSNQRLQSIKAYGLKIIVKADDQVKEIDVLVSNLIIQNGIGMRMMQFNVGSFDHLQSLIIGNDCFTSVKQFRIEHKESLISIQIGENSFTSQKKGRGKDSSKSFSVISCPSLKSIEIGCFSFSDYAGKFELNQLPSLETIKIGEVGMPSMNFSSSSFIVQSQIHSNQLLLDLPKLKSIELGDEAFIFSENTVFESHIGMNESLLDLRSLRSISLGAYSLQGDDNDSCSLLMKSIC